MGDIAAGDSIPGRLNENEPTDWEAADLEPEEARRLVDALAEVKKPPFQVVQGVVDHNWTFAIGHFPSEIPSDEEPPVRLDEHAEVIPIDEFLGRYSPQRQEVKIFRRGIEQAASRLSLPPQDITFLIRLHEWAHALLHLGLPEENRLRVTEDDKLWPETLAKATAAFHALESGLHERLAQLIVHHAVQSLRSEAKHLEAQKLLDRLAQTFQQLTQHAPNDYRIDKYTAVPRSKFVKSIELLKSGGLVGLTAWETVITW